jgi:GNAT superfamily N-acetyltransferase
VRFHFQRSAGLTITSFESTRLNDELLVWRGTANREVVNLIQRMFAEQGENRSTELLEWQYLRHLTGAEVCIAHTSAGLFEEPVALYAAFPTVLAVDGQRTVGFQSFDTLTSEPFRGRGLFVTLAEFLYERLRNQGASLVYGIPNGDSIGGFIRRLGWTSLDPFPMMVRPVGTRYVRVRAKLRTPQISHPSRLEHRNIREVTACSADVDELLVRSNYRDTTGVVRDYAYLSWRLQRPGSTYRILETRDDSGALMGVLVFDVLPKHGCSVGYIMELMTDRVRGGCGDELLEAAINLIKRANADVILAWSLESNSTRASLRSQGFRKISSRLSPIELHLGYRSLSTEERLVRNDWAFSYLDSDTV